MKVNLIGEGAIQSLDKDVIADINKAILFHTAEHR